MKLKKRFPKEVKVIVFLLTLFFNNQAVGVDLIIPNGGELLVATGAYTILWKYHNEFEKEIYNIYLYYSINNGDSWQKIDINEPWNEIIRTENYGFCVWDPIPVVDSNQCLIHIDLSYLCIEWIGPSCWEADIDWDWDVDVDDFIILASAWQSGPDDDNWNPNCDISDPNDNIVDFRDLSVFAYWWLFGTYETADTSDDVFAIFQP